jgi:transposase
MRWANPLAVSLTGGHVHDVTQAPVLIQEIEPAALLADKGSGNDGFIEHLDVRRIKPVIPPRAKRKTPRECDFALYCERNLVERFFNIIKHSRAIATRDETTAQKRPRRRPPRLHPGVAQMTTGPSDRVVLKPVPETSA